MADQACRGPSTRRETCMASSSLKRWKGCACMLSSRDSTTPPDGDAKVFFTCIHVMFPILLELSDTWREAAVKHLCLTDLLTEIRPKTHSRHVAHACLNYSCARDNPAQMPSCWFASHFSPSRLHARMHKQTNKQTHTHTHMALQCESLEVPPRHVPSAWCA
jgi:hypothetical protein